ncbi:MAG: hypothetical protein KDC85_05285 [Saprospiraceae bacterium]|nr:hypothetical protein [Saprospiraceae bacterium]MCB9324988.1 hypothetical protein [Lewinellaceae bacterium]
MRLNEQEYNQYIRIHPKLIYFAGKKLALFPKNTTLEKFLGWSVEKKYPIREALYENLHLLDEFIHEFSKELSKEDIELIQQFKHFTKGTFVVVKLTSEHAIFMDDQFAYEVLALSDPFEMFWGNNLPVMVEAVLLPFKDKIIYDGIISSYPILIGPGMKESIMHDFNRIVAQNGVISQLPVDEKIKAHAHIDPEESEIPTDEELDFFQEELEAFMAFENRQPMPEIDNLSPQDMHHILYQPFEDVSPIQWKVPVDKNVFTQEVPFFKLITAYLKMVEEAGQMKLTPKGNLQVKTCKDLYALGIINEGHIEKGTVKLNKESDSIVLQTVRIIADLAGITKKRHGKVSLTAKGKKLLDKPDLLFRAIFQTYYQKFNWEYHDLYEDNGHIQNTFGYLLYLLLQYGKEERNLQFYVEKYLLAFPFILEAIEPRSLYHSAEKYTQNCIHTRVFSRFLNWFGFIEERTTGKKFFDIEYFIRTSDTFRKIMELDASKFQFERPEGYA